MKKRGILIVVFALLVLTVCLLAACDDNANKPKVPTHLSFDNPYMFSTPLEPVYLTSPGMPPLDTDFDLSKIKLYIEYSDGTKSEPIILTESMLAPENTGNYLNGTGLQVFTIQYTVNNVTVKGTFRVYTKARTDSDFATLTFVTNGGSPNSFTKKFTKGTTFGDYASFVGTFTKVTKAGHTLLGWVILPQDFDYRNKTAEEIDAKANTLVANIYSPTAWPTDIQVVRNLAFCAVWQENTTRVTFNYNYAANGITQDLYLGSGLPTAPVSDLYAPKATLPRPLIPDNVIAGWRFAGWFTNSELTSARSFNQPVGNTDFTLYAKWEQVFYTIKFNLVGGQLNDDFFIVADDSLLYEKNSPAATAHPNLLRGAVTKYDSTGAVSVVSYQNLSYNTLFNQSLASPMRYLACTTEMIAANHYISKGYYEDEVLQTSGYYYEFAGWYRDEEYTTAYVFNGQSRVPAEDLELYAKWNIDETISDQYYENYLFKDKYIVKADNTIKITGVNDLRIAKIALPDTINGKFITEIGDDAFAGCILLSSFSINQTSMLEKIGARAFRFCSKLEEFQVKLINQTYQDIATTSVTLKVNSVGKDAFRGTTWISAHTSKWIKIGKVLVKYKGAENVEKVVATIADIPANERDGLGTDDVIYDTYGTQLQSVDRICADAFKGFSRLRQIIIPNSIKYIEDDAFIGCTALSLITVQEKSGGGYNLVEVGGSSFSETAWFKYPSLEDNNFAQYSALILGNIYYKYSGSKAETTTMATIPAGVSIIAPDAFRGYGNIRSINFASKSQIETIGVGALNDTAWYTLTGNANNGFIIINGIVIGYIGQGTRLTAADGQSQITAVYVPEFDTDGVAVKKIATNAFYGYYANNIDAIAMPETITEIMPYAFKGCVNLTKLTYLGSKKPHIFNGTPNTVNQLPTIYESTFYGVIGGVLVNPNLKLYLNNETDALGSSLYQDARTDTEQSRLYYKIYQANNAFIGELRNNGIRVKAGTLASGYVNYPGWSLTAEWQTTRAFEPDNPNRAMLVIMRTDGLPYETPLLYEYIDPTSIDSSITTSVNNPHVLEITYNGFYCEFEYRVEAKISAISIDNGASESSLMSRAQYFETSKRFVYSGGYINITYEDAGIAPLRLSLTDLVGTVVQITGFTVFKVGSNTLKFTYSTAMQTVQCNYEYLVNEIENVDIEFLQPLKVEIDDEVDLHSVILKIIRNDIADGGQIFDPNTSGYAYDNVRMDNAKVKILRVDGVSSNKFLTSAFGVHTVVLQYGSAALGYTPEIELEYEVVLKTAQSWFNFEALTLTDTVWQVVEGINIYEGTAKITGAKTGHLPTIVIPEFIDTTVNGMQYRLKVVEIGQGAFENSSVLVNIHIAPTVQKIANNAFLNCANLQLVEFLDGTIDTELWYIGNRAFEGAVSLAQIALPETVSYLGFSAFKGSALTSIDLSGTAITEISPSAFKECTALQSVALPDGLLEVGNEAFSGCTALTSVTLGAEIEFIGTHAFYYCADNFTVTINATEVPVFGQSYPFGTTRAGLVIRVPEALYSDYVAALSVYAAYFVAI